jgi:Flp pilus assembly pilin Flp
MGHRDAPRHLRSERAASLVEYVLLVALVALATLAGLGVLGDGAERATGNTAEKISRRSVPTVPEGGGGGGGGGPATTTTTTTAPTTTTTAPTTTTTAAPTTTTTSTTTTTQPATSRTTWGSTSKQTRSGEWKALANLTVTNGAGQPISGATVVVKVEYRGWWGWSTASNLTATTSGPGSLTLDSGWYSSSGWFPIDEIRFTVVSVTKPGVTWDGAQPSVSVTR